MSTVPPNLDEVEAVAGRTPGSPAASRQKKVRLACQRCRERRIKCDGETPSCSKCAKAGVPCIDVDARKGGSTISRAFSSQAQARIDWLESLVKTYLPDIDVAAGPTGFERHSDSNLEVNTPGSKRRLATTIGDDQDPDSVPQKARRVALDLGLFSLNTDAYHTRYLGSSSGSLFAHLLPQGQSVDACSEPESDPEPIMANVMTARKSISGDLFVILREVLPVRAECDRMIALFYDHYHADYPLLHQPSFRSLVDALYTCAESPSGSTVQHHGWLSSLPPFSYNGIIGQPEGSKTIPLSVGSAATQLFFVLSIAADLQTRRRCFTADPSKFRSQALALFQITLAEVSIASIQSMLLYVLQSFLAPGQGDGVWMILHIALAYAVDLGIHRHAPASTCLNQVASQMRRRSFFCLYALDRFVSTVQGRPLGFADETLDLCMPQPISDAEAGDSDQLFLTYSIAGFRWAVLISTIKHQLYRFIPEPTFRRLDISAAAVCTQLHRQLDAWLPESLATVTELTPKIRRRLEARAEIDYHFAIGLIYQPSQTIPNPGMESIDMCFSSAVSRIRLLWDLHDHHDLTLSWPRTHSIFSAGATLVYCVWTSANIRATVQIAELAADLRLCTNLLTLGSEWWPLARRGRRSFERLADATLSVLSRGTSSRDGHVPQSVQPTTLASNQLSLPIVPDNWADVEHALQSFLQYDFQLTDMLDTLDASPLGCVDPSWINQDL